MGAVLFNPVKPGDHVTQMIVQVIMTPKVAEVEAAKAVAIRDAELQMEVEIKNALCQTEKLKAEQLSKATVQYETQVSTYACA